MQSVPAAFRPEESAVSPRPKEPSLSRAELSSWLELDAAALRHNLAVFRGLAGRGSLVGAVVKGNAYGHGFREVLSILHAQVDCLYVIAPSDALAVRALEAEQGLERRRVLVLGPASGSEGVELARQGIELVLGDESFPAIAAALRAQNAGPLDVHVHVDTGLGREGFHGEELEVLRARLARDADVLRLRGVLSHFANVEDVTEQAYALEQVRRFERGADALAEGAPLERHMAASAASLVLPASRLDALRVGIALYGLWPSAATRVSTRVVLGETPALRPVLSWRCKSQVVRTLTAGSYVGYGCTYRCVEETRIAVLPVGYFDGYPRLLSDRAHVLVDGRRCAVLGRVMMNHLIVNVTGTAAGRSEVTATLLGSDGEEALSADTLAAWSNTISYELVTRLGSHLRRVVVNDG
jgi:alanine racemase